MNISGDVQESRGSRTENTFLWRWWTSRKKLSWNVDEEEKKANKRPFVEDFIGQLDWIIALVRVALIKTLTRHIEKCSVSLLLKLISFFPERYFLLPFLLIKIKQGISDVFIFIFGFLSDFLLWTFCLQDLWEMFSFLHFPHRLTKFN